MEQVNMIVLTVDSKELNHQPDKGDENGVTYHLIPVDRIAHVAVDCDEDGVLGMVVDIDGAEQFDISNPNTIRSFISQLRGGIALACDGPTLLDQIDERAVFSSEAWEVAEAMEAGETRKDAIAKVLSRRASKGKQV